MCPVKRAEPPKTMDKQRLVAQATTHLEMLTLPTAHHACTELLSAQRSIARDQKNNTRTAFMITTTQ